MTLGSLFDGSGGFPLAGVMNGITPVWSSEIEAYPLRVTALRFPDVKQLGDVTKINGAEIDPVDIITFGSPCQDLSVAGKQAGIHDGERSNLFFEAIRIIKEMRDADKGTGRTGKHIRPRFAVWENVPGAFSSNKGEDFRAVLQAFAGICSDGLDIPGPPRGKWSHAGGMAGEGWSVAWRVYDAQYWGVPQRRKRIYLVADFGSERAHEILFERESVRGNPAESGEAREGTAANAEGSAGRGGSYIDRATTLATNTDQSVCYPINTMVATRGGKDDMRTCFGIGEPGEPQFTSSVAHEHGVCYALQGNGIDRADTAGCNGSGWREWQMYTLNTIDRHGVCYVPTSNHCGTFAEADVAATLATRYHYGSGGDAAMVCYDCRGNGDGKISPTLTGDHQSRVTDYTAVCVGNGQMDNISMKPIANALDCMHDQQAVVYPGVGITSPQNGNNPQPGDPAPTVTNDSRNYLVADAKPPRKYIVRRLTPLECCRLQGFPNVAKVDVEAMTRDEMIAFCLAEGLIKVDFDSGKVYGCRGPGGMMLDGYRELKGATVNGYTVHSLNVGGCKKQIREHRIVWTAAHGLIPDGMVIDHINNDKTDNRLCNLQLLTPAQNSTKARADGLYKTGDDAPQAKSTEAERKLIAYLYWHTDTTHHRLAAQFGLSKSRIGRIVQEYQGWDGDIEGSDSARYKMWGNGIALPCAYDVLHRIAMEVEREDG